MNASRLTILGMMTMTMICSSNACHLFKKKRKNPQSDPIPPATQYADEQPLRAPVEERPVKTGSLPLVYLLEFPGELRIVDASASRVLYTARAGGRTIVSLDAEKGVTIGGRNVLRGPLDPRHEYEIYLMNPSDNVSRNVYERR
jgi:hypothetical protein